MTAKTTKTRVAELRQRRATEGLIRFEVKAYPEDKAAIKAFASLLTSERTKQNKVK